MKVDLNVDAGEAYGRWKLADESALFQYVSSVNLACGFHAGDPLTMLASVTSALEQGVAVGAHPGYPDLVGFGRRELAANPDEIYGDVLYQIGALAGMLAVKGTPLHHVKAHGALYLRMMRDRQATRAVAHAVSDFDPSLPLVILGGTGGTLMADVADEMGAATVLEAFPDRAYLSDGTLAERWRPGSVINDPKTIASRAVAIATGRSLEALDGGTVDVQGHTLCLHGDNADAAQNGAEVVEALNAEGIAVEAY